MPRQPFTPLPPAAFAALGDGKIAYLKLVKSDDVIRLFPDATDVPQGLNLWALHAADGTPILVTDNRDMAVANALDHDLATVAVH
jgi:hypothetical protein